MKKVMFTAAAALCATVGAIESQNIVGYQDVSKGAVAKPMFGFTFVPVDGSTSVKLGSVTVSGMRGGYDYIQVINPTTLSTDARYTYYSLAQAQSAAADSAQELVDDGDYDDYDEAYADEFARFSARVGWWNGAPGGSTRSEDVDIPVGSGFLVSGNASRPLTFTCSGEAPITAKSYAPGAVAKPIVANFLPARFYLQDMTVTGMRGGYDYLQVINPTSLGTDARYTYYSLAQAQSAAADSAQELVDDGDYDDYDEAYADEFARFSARVGWWNGAPGGSTRSETVIVNPGDAFLVSGNASRPLTFNFKGVLDLTPISE